MRFWKHELPDGIMDSDEVCIGWVALDWWGKQGWKTKRLCYAKLMPVVYTREAKKELCAAIVVKRSEMLNRGWEERESVFVKSFEWEETV